MLAEAEVAEHDTTALLDHALRQMRVDKASAIVNAPNELSDDPRVDLLKRTVTVSPQRHTGIVIEE
ncbi:hypothetical protein HCC61_23005 [Streptomyces sp. HNM0575]|uniref:hypothetical protein n=1 Tax=Streptomyces sp. HNM0575 TaxID=2716338 RepID=UPI00145DEF07|nr:hypothetical protein [Streptomyces sp. HNM0575]NLU75499.1 hypothetical protein [Streptomyces sp. HNM0575]